MDEWANDENESEPQNLKSYHLFIRNVKHLSGLRYTFLEYREILNFPFCNQRTTCSEYIEI